MTKRLCALALSFALAGCGGNSALRPQPSLEQINTPEAAQRVTSVKLSSDCRRFTKQVAHPNVVGLKPKAAWKAADHALSTANGRLEKADECFEQQVEEYAPPE